MSNPISPVASHVATSASVCLQMITAVVPVPVPVLCAVLGFGAAMLVHNEVGQCARTAAARRRRLVKPTASPENDELLVDEETALLEQAAATASEKKRCTRRRNGNVRSVCGRARWTGGADGGAKSDNDDEEGAPCSPRRVVRRITRGFSWSNSAPASDPVVERDLAALSVALTQEPSAVAACEDDDSPDARSTAAVARQLGPEASHISAAIEHMRFKLDSLMVWKRSVVPTDHTLPSPSPSASGPAEIAGSAQ